MISKELFGHTTDQKEVYVYRMTNDKGNYIEVLNYGCRIRTICVADKDKNLQNVCLGYDTVSAYEKDTCFIGAAVGRCANRIAKGEFELNGITYHVTKNEKENHLHGGAINFGNQLWKVQIEADKLVCRRRFRDGEEGYPGDLEVEITYEWTDENRLIIHYEALGSKDTLVNLTNHTYFNLSGNPQRDILEHHLCILTDKMTPGDMYQIPTGEIISVEGTPFDFQNMHRIEDFIHEDNEQLIIGKGYDHNYVFGSSSMKKMAVLQCEETGIQMSCYSDQPGLQLYTGNNLDDCTVNNSGYIRYAALCLETQNYPDAIHHDNFLSPVLKAGEVYQTTTIYAFKIV